MTELTAGDDGKGQLEFPHNTLTQSTVGDARKTKSCPNINVGCGGIRRMGMCYR